MSVETVVKLKHALKMNGDVMTTTGVTYVEQAITEVEDMLRILKNVEMFGDVWFEDEANIDELQKVLGL